MTKAVAKRAEKAPAVVDEATSIMALIDSAARDPNVDIEKMDRLLDIRRDLKAEASREQFTSDFVLLDFPVIQEKGEASGRYTYARWEDVNAVIEPILTEHGFRLSFKTETNAKEGTVTVEGILMHRGGHSMTSTYTLQNDDSGNKNFVQASGSAVSYCKRYLAFAMLNLTSSRSEDDDAHKAGALPISKADFNKLNKALDEQEVDKEAFCRRFKIEAVSDLPQSKYDLAIAELKARRAERDLKALKEQAA